MAAPTEEGLNGLTKEQLYKVVEHLGFEEVVTKNTKLKTFMDLVKEKIVERMILSVDTQSKVLLPESSSTPLAMTGVKSRSTFEQQLEILNLQSKERELDRQLELKKMRVQERECE